MFAELHILTVELEVKLVSKQNPYPFLIVF